MAKEALKRSFYLVKQGKKKVRAGGNIFAGTYESV